MKPVVAGVAGVIAIGAGILVWGLVAPHDEEPSQKKAPPPKEFSEVRLENALRHLKAADTATGTDKTDHLFEAAQLLDALEGESPKDDQLPFWRGIVAAMAGEAAAANAALLRLAAANPQGQRSPYYLYLKAMVILQFEEAKPERAVDILRGLRSQAPSFMPEPVARALYRALLAHAVSLEPWQADKSVLAVQEAIPLARGDRARTFEVHRMLAKAYGRAARYQEAEGEWQSLVKQTDGKVADFQFGLANAYAAQNLWDKAIEHFTIVLDMVAKSKSTPSSEPTLKEARMRRGNCYKLLGKNAEAQADLEAYVAMAPEDHRGLYWLGSFYLDPLDEPDKAGPLLERARMIAPYCDAYLRMLLNFYEVRKPDPAKAQALREELEKGLKDRKATREKMGKEHRDGGFICE